MNMRLFFSLKYSFLILFGCFRIPLIPSEAQICSCVGVWRKIVVKLHFHMLKTESIHLQRFELMKLNLSVLEAFLSLSSRFLKFKMFFFMKSLRQCSLKYENQSFTQNILSKFCTRCCPSIYVAIMCTSLVEITVVIENAYLVLTVILLQVVVIE